MSLSIPLSLYITSHQKVPLRNGATFHVCEIRLQHSKFLEAQRQATQHLGTVVSRLLQRWGLYPLSLSLSLTLSSLSLSPSSLSHTLFSLTLTLTLTLNPHRKTLTLNPHRQPAPLSPTL